MRKPPLQDVIVKSSGARPVRPHMSHDDRAPHTHTPAGEYDTHRTVALPPRRERPYEESVHRRPASYDTQPYDDGSDTGFDDGSRKERAWLMIALSVGALIVVSAFGLSLLFAGASVTAFPKQDTLVANTSFKSTVDGSEGTVSFKKIVLERTATKSVPAQAEQEVEERASGVITIYNAYAETPQRLIKNTRFQSADGKVFRIRESVEVPGKKSDTAPGSIEVTVYAEEPGDSYNIAPGDFSIPGFVKLPQEGKVYARSSVTMAGGFKGIRRTVDDAARQTAMKDLEGQLRDELLAAAFDSKDRPADYLLFKEAVFFEFTSLPDEVSGDDQVTLSLTGKVHSMLFPEDAFAQRLAELTVASYVGSPIRIDNPYDLTVGVTPDTATGGVDETGGEVRAAWDASAYTVKVEGKVHFIWEFDPAKLAIDLTGKDKTILDVPTGGILDAYPGIDRIHATVRPFWKKTFPDKPVDIVVVTDLDS